MSDRRRIVQVLSNLISNAARHSQDSTAIRVMAMEEDFYVTVSVVDQGRGVSAERLPHLFRKFTRIEGDDGRREIERTGLGLSICKGLVEAHGGRICAESDGLGKGARLIFTLPVADKDELGDMAGSTRFSDRSWRAENEGVRILAASVPHALRHVCHILS